MSALTAGERIGTSIGGAYTLGEVLAQGGMGVVFRATQRATGRPLAVKLLKATLGDGAHAARLLQEARAATAVRHPNVVELLDLGLTDDGVPYLVMELLEGRTLKDELKARGSLGAEETLATLLPVIGAMALAHDQGIVHRDLKPANVFLSRGAHGRVVPKLLDFGVAKLPDSVLTRSGIVLGTLHYLSPEQADPERGRVGPQTDVWAFGVILYECLTGRTPFRGDARTLTVQRILREPPPPLRDAAPHVGPTLAAAIERALRRDQAARYADLRSLARALADTARAEGVALPHDPDPLGLPEWRSWAAQHAHAPSTAPALDASHAHTALGRAASRRAAMRRVAWLLVLASAIAASAWAWMR